MAFCTHCSVRVYTGFSRVDADTTSVTPARSRPGGKWEGRPGCGAPLGGWAGPCRGRGRGGARVHLCVEVRVCVRAGKSVSVCWGQGARSVSTRLTAKGCEQFSDL